ncbi:MAG: hypothetical protein MK108_11095 [Mariniblastus sp.]|nr:hypothetical protein [Mariniblastus sp.]
MARRRNNGATSWRYVILHPALWFMLATVGMIFGAIQLWHTHYQELIDLPGYEISRQQIQVNAPPEWVDADLEGTILGRLPEPASLLDRQLVPTTVTTCESLPWVEKISRIEKVPAGLDVELVYRQPVGLVEISTSSGQQAIDRHGVLMDPRMMDYVNPENLIRISVARPGLEQQKIWTVWQDHRVVDAASIGSLQGAAWDQLGCYRIVSWDPPGSPSNQNPFEIWPRTARGIKIVWGSAPGKEKTGEASAEQKLEVIRQYLAKLDPSKETELGRKVDVRSGSARLVDDVKTAQWSEFDDQWK